MSNKLLTRVLASSLRASLTSRCQRLINNNKGSTWILSHNQFHAIQQRISRNFHISIPSQKSIPFLLADIGEGIKEVEIIQWFIKEGDPIKQFDKVAEVQSDKANVEISSRYDGIVKKLYYKQGEMAHVGQPLIDIETSEDVHPEPEKAEVVEQTSKKESAKSIHAIDRHVVEESIEKVLTTPAVRRIARENHINLCQVKATGPRGRILKEDVLNYLKGTQQEEPLKQAEIATISATEKVIEQVADRVETVRGLRRTMIKTMNASNAVPQFGLHDEVNVDRLIVLRNEFKAIAAKRGVEKLTFMPFFVKAVSMALKDYPILNSSLSADESQITYKSSHNVGIAMDTPQGLVVPNIKNVQNLSILEIASELNRLIQLGAQGKLGTDDLKGGTITLSNVGTIGGTYARPLLTPPEVCIGAIGKIRKVPMFDKSDRVVPVNIMYVSWSGDHRIIDGATLTRFSNAWKEYLETPEAMMLNMK